MGSSEEFVYVIKGGMFETPNKWEEIVSQKELPLEGLAELGTAQKQGSGVSELIDWLEKHQISLSINGMRNEMDNNQVRPPTIFHATFDKEVFEFLAGIFRRPFFKVICNMTEKAFPNIKRTLKSKIDVLDILENRRGHYYQMTQQLFTIRELIDPEVTCDVVLGWVHSEKLKFDVDSFVQKLYANETSKDVTIVAANKAELKCHKLILEGHSDVLAKMLSPANGMKESTTGRIELTGNSEEALTLLIRYMYGLELSFIKVSSTVAVELFKISHLYEIALLQNFVGDVLGKRGVDWYSPDDLLELYFHVKNIDGFQNLEEYLLCLVLSVPQKIRECDRFQELQQTNPKVALELVWKLFDMK